MEDGQPDGVFRPEVRSAWILDSENQQHLYLDFENKVRTVIQSLILKLWGVKLYSCDGTQLIRYKPGDRYLPHKDSSEDATEISFASRYFTILCYLNDSFLGGTTTFPTLGYTAMPVSGKALIFPSHYWHSAVSVAGGEKFVLLTWVCGPVPLRWI